MYGRARTGAASPPLLAPALCLDVRPWRDSHSAWLSRTGSGRPGQHRRLTRAARTFRHLRGAEVIEIRDAEGNLFNDFRGRVRPEDSAKGRSGTRRTLLLALDAAQYQRDVDALEAAPGARDVATGAAPAGGAQAIYGAFNVVQRRRAKENNFKAVLESIRDLMSEEAVIPAWMHDLFLGYGDPADAQYTVRS
jgi:Intron-binding protein aquarius N-terminus